ncbi:MAG: hypothetical protein HS111_36080 [Kofleriaceae bacterium]|nr:hypothetical protein [Kofleriaceae bacterium]
MAELAHAAVEYAPRHRARAGLRQRHPRRSSTTTCATSPTISAATVELVATTSGRTSARWCGGACGRGRWDVSAEDISEWRIILPTGLHFCPAGFAAAAIVRADLDDLDTTLDAPPRMRPFVEQALARMSDVTEDDYYSLCGRLDTLEHVHEVLVAVAARPWARSGGGRARRRRWGGRGSGRRRGRRGRRGCRPRRRDDPDEPPGGPLN